MKKIIRFVNFAVLLAAFAAVGATAGFAQDDPCADTDGQIAAYTVFSDNYVKKDIPGRKAAIDGAKKFMEKYGACESVKVQSDFMKENLPKMEAALDNLIKKEDRAALLSRYDAGIKGKNYDEAYAAGKEFASKFPKDETLINVIIPLGQIGLLESAKKNYKYNNDTVKFANQALDMLKGGVKSTKANGKFGVFDFEDTKEEVLSDLTFTLGYIAYYVNNDKANGVDYYYRVAQMPGGGQKNPQVYITIGAFYLDTFDKVGAEIGALVKLQNGTDTEDVKLAREGEIKAKVAFNKGYSERAMDALGRALKVAGTDAASKELRTSIETTAQALYEFRFEKKDGLKPYLTEQTAKAMPDPKSEVIPIADEPAATTPETTKTSVVQKPTTAVVKAEVAPVPAVVVKPQATKAVAKAKAKRKVTR